MAFEVAQQLRRVGQQVALLAIIDVPAQSAHFRHVRRLTRLASALLGLSRDRELRAYLRLRDSLFRLNYFLRLGHRDSVRRFGERLQRPLRRVRRLLWSRRGQAVLKNVATPTTDEASEREAIDSTRRHRAGGR